MPNIEQKYGGISSEAVRAKTGKGWDEWLELLDAENAQALPHKEIAALLQDTFRVPDWWCQMVTVGYEQARGLRAVHQTADGYSASVSKTLNAPLSALYRACADATTRTKWMGRKKHTVSKVTPNKSLRIAWAKDGATRVALELYAKRKSKSQIVVQHSKLAGAEDVEKMKTYWRGALEKLAALIEK
jgi:uncharacterized protein YndB with AHSA1/START domain